MSNKTSLVQGLKVNLRGPHGTQKRYEGSKLALFNTFQQGSCWNQKLGVNFVSILAQVSNGFDGFLHQY